MQENAEYCDGQDFRVVFILKTVGKRLWQCSRCAYEFTQALTETESPAIPAYHPKPIPTRFTVSERQRARLKAQLQQQEKKHQGDTQ